MKYGTMTFLSVDEMVLMIKKTERQNDPNSGFFTLPGGNLKNFERGANPTGRLESAIREIEEESGLTLIKPILSIKRVIKGYIQYNDAGENNTHNRCQQRHWKSDSIGICQKWRYNNC